MNIQKNPIRPLLFSGEAFAKSLDGFIPLVVTLTLPGWGLRETSRSPSFLPVYICTSQQEGGNKKYTEVILHVNYLFFFLFHKNRH